MLYNYSAAGIESLLKSLKILGMYVCKHLTVTVSTVYSTAACFEDIQIIQTFFLHLFLCCEMDQVDSEAVCCRELLKENLRHGINQLYLLVTF